MQAGISSFAFSWGVRQGSPPVDEQFLIAFAVRHGLKVVQLGDNLAVHEMPPARRAALRDAMTAAGLRLELGARGLTRERLGRYLELCRELGAPLLRFVADSAGHEPDPRWIVELLREARPELAASSVTLAMENHDRLGAAELRSIIDAVDSPQVGICLDSANSLGAGEGLDQVSALLAPVTVNLHLKDVTIRRWPHQMGFAIEGCPLGRGRLPLRTALERVRAAGRCASVILEAWSSPAGSPEETVRREHESAEESVGVLRSWLAI